MVLAVLAYLASIEAKMFEVVVDRVFPFAESRAAFEHMAGQGHFGKIAIRVA